MPSLPLTWAEGETEVASCSKCLFQAWCAAALNAMCPARRSPGERLHRCPAWFSSAAAVPAATQDFSKADAIVAAIKTHLASSHDVDDELPRWAGIISLEDNAINVKVNCHTSTKATHEYGAELTPSLKALLSGRVLPSMIIECLTPLRHMGAAQQP